MKSAAPCVVLVALAGLLAACHPPPVAWSKPGANEAALRRDLQACATEARATTPSYFDSRTMSVVSDPQDMRRLQTSCMTGRGWKLSPQP